MTEPDIIPCVVIHCCIKNHPKAYNNDCIISHNYVKHLNQTLLYNSSAFVTLVEVLFLYLAGSWDVLKVQDDITPMCSALGRMSGRMNPVETVDQSAYIWPLQHGGVRAVKHRKW